jgi:hypothetical protein
MFSSVGAGEGSDYSAPLWAHGVPPMGLHCSPGPRRNDNAKTISRWMMPCSDQNILYSLSGAFSIRCPLSVGDARGTASHYLTYTRNEARTGGSA